MTPSGSRSAGVSLLPPPKRLVADKILSPFVNEKGQSYSDCLFENYKVWMEESNIATSTGYHEGFHREDFEDEKEPILAARSTVSRWIPVLFAFSDPNRPITWGRLPRRTMPHGMAVDVP